MIKSIINSLTFSRIVFGILFFYFALFDFNVAYLIIIFILSVLSDRLDGYLSRKYNLASDKGARLDVMCDFIFIIVSSLAVALIDLAPFWFLIVIILKLMEFLITSGKSLKYDRLGHYVALMFYTFPIVAILINSKNITLIWSIIITICAIISSLSRIKNMREQQ